MTMLPDNQTVMLVVRPDGDCDCHNLHSFPQCGVYRPYQRLLSTNMGVSWIPAAI